MSLTFAELLAQNKGSIVQELAQMVKVQAGPTYASVPLEQLLPRMEEVFDYTYEAIAQDDPRILRGFVVAVVSQRVAERYALQEIQTLISLLREIVLRYLEEAYQDDPPQHLDNARQLEDLAHHARQAAFEVYIESFEEQSEVQRRALAEISTPVIRVYENVLVLPLVGAIDTERAHRIMEELLTGITHHQAELVIIDITGVPLVDTAVANHLLQTIKAARLLGTRSILVGISSEVAQALVHLQIDISGVVTRSNLQAGIEYALEQMGLEIAPQAEILLPAAQEKHLESEEGHPPAQRR